MPFEGNHFWLQYNQNWYSPTSPNLYSTYQLIAEKDTLINLKVFHKITTFGPITNGFQGGYIIVQNALLRQDTLSKRIYFFNRYTNSERLLYDFSKNIGDTIKNIAAIAVSQFPSGPDLLVKNIDTVQLNDGLPHKRFFLKDGYYTYEVIEGIGSKEGLLNPYAKSISGPSNRLICHGVINPFSSVYSNPVDFGNCNFTTSVKESENLVRKINIFPNPSTGKLMINLPQPESFFSKIKIINSVGKLVYDEPYLGPELNVELLPNGIYYVILEKHIENFSFKIVKE